jgi:hypothetical protein
MFRRGGMSGDQVATLAGTIIDGGWVASGLEAGGSMASLEATMKPVDALVSAGLGFLAAQVQPLQEVLDRLAGKASVVQSFAGAWQQVSTQVDQVRQRLAQSATTDTAQWLGAAGDRYRAHAAGTTSALGQIVALAAAASKATTTMGKAAAGGRQQAGELLNDLVQRLISFATQAIAAEGGITSTVLAQATSMVNAYTSPISAIEQRVRQTTNTIAPLLTALAGAMTGAPTTQAAAAQPTTPASALAVGQVPGVGQLPSVEPASTRGRAAAADATRGFATAAASSRVSGRKRVAQADDLDSHVLDSPRGNTTIRLPDGKTIRVKPGGEYRVPRGSKVFRNGTEIMTEQAHPNGSRFLDGTQIRRVENPPAW